MQFRWRRFLAANQENVEQAKQQAFETIVWRNRMQLHELQPSCFPQEFYQMGGLYECGPDHFGLPVLCIRAKCIRKAHLLDRMLSQFLAYRLHLLEKRLNRLEGWTFLFDCTSIGFANVNLELIKFLMELLRLRYPLSLRYALVLEVPFLLNAVQKVVMAMLPEENTRLVRFVNRRQLQSYVPVARLPFYLDGTSSIDIGSVPVECRDRLLTLCTGKYKLTEAEARRQCRPYLEMFADLQIGTNRSVDCNNNNNRRATATNPSPSIARPVSGNVSAKSSTLKASK